MELPFHRSLVVLTVLALPALGWSGEPPRPTISVSGTAEVRVPPNEVNLRLGIETRDPALDEARQQNELRTAGVLRFLKGANIDAKDIQTDYLQIEPQYGSDGRQPQIVPEFYQVRRTIGVRLRDVGQFDTVLAGVLTSGANQVQGIDFRTTELRKHRDAARQQAIRAAKQKATALAAELDAQVGKPLMIQEHTSDGWGGWPGRWGPFANAMSQVSSQAPAAGEAPEGNLAVGMISITATVSVTFLLE